MHRVWSRVVAALARQPVCGARAGATGRCCLLATNLPPRSQGTEATPEARADGALGLCGEGRRDARFPGTAESVVSKNCSLPVIVSAQ